MKQFSQTRVKRPTPIPRYYFSFILFAFLFLLATTANAQQVQVSGQVTDSDTGDPLPGAVVRVVNTSDGVATDSEGRYSLTVASDATLSFSYIGYLEQEIDVDGRSILDVSLAINSSELESVVVVDYGYGTVQREDMTGSVASISSRELSEMPVSSTAEALSGRLPGVNITSTDGEPGAEMRIRVRGGGSVTQDNSPLYVVDGFIVDGINDIPPTDIESINVLKDASATAIYGAQAANGVVVVTTKSPQAGKISINYNNFFQYNLLPEDRRYEVLSPYEYALANYEVAALRSEADVRNYER